MDQIFTVEILETWITKKKVRASSRTDALAKVKAELIGSGKKKDYYEPDDAEEMELRSVEVQLEFPDGNPEKVED